MFNLRSSRPRPLCKTVNLIDTPSLEQLSNELRILGVWCWVLLRLVGPKMGGVHWVYHDIPWYTSNFQSLSCEMFPQLEWPFYAVLGMPVLYPHSAKIIQIQTDEFDGFWFKLWQYEPWVPSRGLAWQNGELWKGHLVIWVSPFLHVFDAVCKTWAP